VRRLLREPLAHFLLIGAVIFAVDALRDQPADAAARAIVITERDIQRLTLAWERARQRPPTPAELDGMIRDAVKEEVYYREALRLGLDEGDPVVRRRMRQKMEAIAAAAADAAAPTDDDLRALLAAEPRRYAGEARLSFEQVYVGDGDAEAMLATLRGGGTVTGSPIGLPHTMTNAAASVVARTFGSLFAAELAERPVGEWTGPIESGFGRHIVRISARTADAPPRFADVRERLEADWRQRERRKREAAAYQALLDGYRIEIERP
jgi:peptidyl-prolyl cis-trans isomerase C